MKKKLFGMGFAKLVALAFGFSMFISCGGVYAAGPSHAYINKHRSSLNSHYYVTQAIDGEFGDYTRIGNVIRNTSDARPVHGEDTDSFKGTGIKTAVGVEMLKFIQFAAGHTYINMRNQEDRLENLIGSRLHGEARLIFAAPIGNLEASSGVTASRLDYMRLMESSGFAGTGVYYSLGVNYFTSQKLSVFGEYTTRNETLVRDGGSAKIKKIQTSTSGLGFGFRIWL